MHASGGHLRSEEGTRYCTLACAGVPSALLSKTKRARAGLIDALKAQSSRHSSGTASAAAEHPRPGKFQPDVPPLVHARWAHFKARVRLTSGPVCGRRVGNCPSTPLARHRV